MHSITHDKRFYNEEKHFRTTLLCRLFLTAQPVLSDICVQQGVAYQSREGRIGLLSKADRYLMTLNGHLDLPGVFLLCALIYHSRFLAFFCCQVVYDEWAIGLKRELKYDVLNGFVGKTVIHPNQIPVVVDSLKVKKQDYDDAMEILSWRDDSALLVGGSAQKERMNEVNTHLRWAKRVASLAAVYGVQND